MTRSAVAFIRPSTSQASPPPELEIVATIKAETVRPALERLAADRCDALFLTRLADAAGSLGDVIGLLDWLAAAGGDLIAADVGLDSSTDEGGRMAGLLREIDGWRRHPSGDRRPPGRPGLGARSPALADRIAALRDRGLSLQAIATQLNGERVPTPRGGALWRPSSVQAALGYRRPRPPVGGPPPAPAGRREGHSGRRGPGKPGPPGRGPAPHPKRPLP